MFQSNNTMRHIFLLLLAISLLFSFCSAESINIENVKEATDEELKTAYEIIVAEQKSRIKASLQFPEKEVSIGIGKTIKLEPVASDIPEGEAETACEWVSSNTEIATVKNGTVKGISTGKCIISCRKTYTSGLTIKDACIVSVDVPIKKITLPKAITIGVKKTVKLDVKYSPDKATNAGFSYTSSDLNVAKVNKSGEITGVGQGTCIITVTALDSGSVHSEVKVTVPALYSEKSEYTIPNKKGLTIEVQCLGSSSDNISFDISSKKLFTLESAEYNKSKGILRFELKPHKQGKGKIKIADSKSKESIELTIIVDKKADSSSPNEIGLYEKDAVLFDIGGVKLVNNGTPEWEKLGGQHNLTLYFTATNTTNKKITIAGSYSYINGYQSASYVHTFLDPGTKGKSYVTFYNMEEMGIYKLSDIKEIKLDIEVFDYNTLKTIADNIIVYINQDK